MRGGIRIGFGTVFRITMLNDQESKFLFSVEGPAKPGSKVCSSILCVTFSQDHRSTVELKIKRGHITR